MSLSPYRRKRNFKKSPEPRGRSFHTNGVLHFVVQKHAASHLHFDFRLENRGVLKSWAVPKGVSTDPQTRRLAIEVEDHPFDYRNFEGIIPAGNYGAGTVMIWDEGEYYADPNLSKEENEKMIAEALQKGHLTFYLNGKKLHGLYTLVKLHRHGREDGQKPQWFLIKKADDFAGEPIAEEDRSVTSGRTLDEIAHQAPAKKKRMKSAKPAAVNSLDDLNLSDAVKAPMPRVVDPMLATLIDKPFDGAEWIFEVKWDGYRILAQKQKHDVRLYSRNNKTYTDHFAQIAAELKQLPFDVILDGEVVVTDSRGVSQFQLLQNYMRSHEGQLVYYVFDILHLDDYDLHKLPLLRRRRILKKILPASGLIRISEEMPAQGKAFFKAAKEHGLEGVIAKRLDSPYQFGRRGRDWLKIKAVREQEAVIGGFTEPRGGRKYFGALVLGLYEDGDLRYIGHTGGGFDDAALKELHARLTPMISAQCPFKVKPKTNAKVTWVKPELMCQVKFQEWTDDGCMRQPIFLGLREDKKSKEIHKETPVPTEKSVSQTVRPANAADRVNERLKLTHLEKVYWPQEGYTKGDMIKYYQTIMPYIFPYLKDRPHVLRRHPHGIEEPEFFQKNIETKPEWITTMPLKSESRRIKYVVCRHPDDVLYMANLGCIEMSPWPSTADKPDYTNYMVLDFDPSDVDFKTLIGVVRESKKILDHARMPGFCKTSGGRGLHVYIPLGQKYTYEQTKDFAHVLCMAINRRIPDLTSLERSPAKRRGRIYLDYLQNHYGATMASVYSLRPRPGAPVSAPLTWNEVKSGLDPQDFNIKTMPSRIKKKGDLWKGVLGPGIDMARVLQFLKV